jgi:hypothetical protein
MATTVVTLCLGNMENDNNTLKKKWSQSAQMRLSPTQVNANLSLMVEWRSTNHSSGLSQCKRKRSLARERKRVK